mmetsp:Transcript_33053/g.45825  ORF Transcript_33053/g.45825 Transcript_33053/m.45825 type:complete len:163 (-) Transcript_33053:213-701(-)
MLSATQISGSLLTRAIKARACSREPSFSRQYIYSRYNCSSLHERNSIFKPSSRNKPFTFLRSSTEPTPSSSTDDVEKTVEVESTSSLKSMEDIKINFQVENTIPENLNIWEGVKEESGKIDWPAFSQVIGSTFLVLGIVIGSAFTLLALNSVLSEVSTQLFG